MAAEAFPSVTFVTGEDQDPADTYAGDPVFDLHAGGKIDVVSSVPLRDTDDLSKAYTPGVARVCTAIAENPSLVRRYTWKANTVAVVTDGTAVLGLGDIGPAASLPVMEGKALLFKEFGGVDAFPICLDVSSAPDPAAAIIAAVEAIAPTFGGINLEDIAAPHAFAVEETLKARRDAEVLCHAKRYERSPDRTDYPAGHDDRQLHTQVGAVPLQVPKLRKATCESR